MGRKRKNAGRRAPWHDYRSRCIYHISLNKATGIADFSHIEGIPGSREWKPLAVPHPEGEVIGRALRAIKERYPFIWIRRRCIMPDHMHFVIDVRRRTGVHLGEIIRAFKCACSDIWEAEGRGAGVQFFEDGYYDVILRGQGQLKKMLDYVSDNPRRWLLRRDNPGWFRRYILSDGSNEYDAFGNLSLLDEWEINAVRIHRHYDDPQELIAQKRGWKETVENDGILVSPFISEAEKRVRDWAADNGGAIIDISTDRMGERYKPAGQYFDICGEGRLLVISMPPGESGLSRAHCERMNKLAEFIASGGRLEEARHGSRP
ncbi:MAG: hypothetical protein K2M10_04050 [Muribaculaceae bacterium]|nr:hypothetical protein [Muribaculaceae bacterium]